MAKDLEELVLSISADNRQMLRVLKKMEGDTSASTRKVEKQFDQMANKIDARLGGIGKNAFRGLLGGAVAALGIREIQQLADTWTDLTSRVDIASGSQEKGVEVMGRLQEMARRTYSGLEQTAESYILNAKALTELGYSTKTQLDYTEALNNAMVVSGAKGDRARSVMEALSKAMALGKLSGENLNTVISMGGRVAEALAASMGVTTLELRKLGMDGKITRKELIGITSQLSKLRDEADGMQATIGDAAQILKDALLAYVGAGDQAVGISARLADAIILVADNFKTVGDAGVQLAFVITSALIGRALTGVVAMVPTTVAAIATMTAAMSAGTLTAAGFAAAMGPIGLAAGALIATLYLLTDRQTEAQEAAKVHDAALKELKYQIETVDYANGEAVASTRKKISADIKAAEVALVRAEAERELAAAIISEEVNPSMSLLPAPAASDLANTVDNSPAVKDRQALIDTIHKQIDDLKAAQADFEDYASGKKKPTREVDRPITPPSDTKKNKRTPKTADDRFSEMIQNVKDRTAALEAEQAALGLSFEAQQKRKIALDLEQEALRQVREEARRNNDENWQTVQLSQTQRDAINQVSEAYARQADELRKAQEAQALQRDMLKGVFGDLRSALEDGKLDWKDLGDIAMNALDKIIDKIENDLIDAIMQANSAADGGGGGLLGWLTKGLGALLGGGIGGSGGGDPWAGLRIPGYANGTNNHPGGLAIVGEKGPELLNLPRGSQVIPQVPQMPALRGSSPQAASQGVHVTVGWSRDADGNLKPFIEEVSQKGIKASIAQYDKGSTYRAARDLREVGSRGYAR